MKIHQIRNATIKVTYAGKTFLIDPWLMEKGQMEGFEYSVNPDVRQPRVDLPISVQEVISGIDAVILTHHHLDHWDDIAGKNLPKDIPFFVDDKVDFDYIKSFGFTNLNIIGENGAEFEKIKIIRTKTQHGRRDIVEPFCKRIGWKYDAMGVVLQAEDQKTLYITGDTIWCPEVKEAIDKYSPSIIVINACGATSILEDGTKVLLIMGIDDIKAISSYAKSSTIIASHMDTVSHLTITRDDIKNLHLPNVLVPSDNEVLTF